jgi:NAD dependent epimerase/dehydratase family enzyme
MSWIAIDDLIHVILHALNTTNLLGPVNAVSPKPVTNAEFTKTLGRVLGRHTIFPMPGLAARIVFGQIADEVLLASNRVEPTKLLETRYVFRSSELEPTLRYLLQKA